MCHIKYLCLLFNKSCQEEVKKTVDEINSSKPGLKRNQMNEAIAEFSVNEHNFKGNYYEDCMCLDLVCVCGVVVPHVVCYVLCYIVPYIVCSMFVV